MYLLLLSSIIEFFKQPCGVRGDRCLMWRFRRSGFVGGEGRSLFGEGIGDRFLWVVSGDRCLI